MSAFDTDDTDCGMTLVEMLIALALTSVIMAMLAAALWSGKRVLLRTEAIAESARTEAVLAHMRNSLSAMRPIRRPGTSDESPLLNTQPGRLTFISEYAPQSQYGGLYVVTWEMKVSGGGASTLVERRTMYRPSRSSMTAADEYEEIVLLPNVARFEVRLLEVRPREAPEWRSNWQDNASLPQLVEVSIARDVAVAGGPLYVRIAGHK